MRVTSQFINTVHQFPGDLHQAECCGSTTSTPLCAMWIGLLCRKSLIPKALLPPTFSEQTERGGVIGNLNQPWVTNASNRLEINSFHYRRVSVHVFSRGPVHLAHKSQRGAKRAALTPADGLINFLRWFSTCKLVISNRPFVRLSTFLLARETSLTGATTSAHILRGNTFPWLPQLNQTSPFFSQLWTQARICRRILAPLPKFAICFVHKGWQSCEIGQFTCNRIQPTAALFQWPILNEQDV